MRRQIERRHLLALIDIGIDAVRDDVSRHLRIESLKRDRVGLGDARHSIGLATHLPLEAAQFAPLNG
jgi:hypothetical protein